MSSWLNYHHLFYFKTIVEEGSVSKAAAKLRLGQPTLSAQLKQLENHLEITLFHREHKKLILSEQGKIAYEYSKNIFEMGSEMREVLHDRIKPHKPHLHLAAIDSVPKEITLSLVERIQKSSPSQITISEGRLQELLRELSAHRIDLVISNYLPTGSDIKGFYPTKISTQKVCAYGSTKFQKLKTGFPESITDHPVIMPSYDSKLRGDITHWAQSLGIHLNICIESQDIAIKKLMATKDMGIIFATEISVKEELDRKSLFKIGSLKNVSEDIYLISAHRKIENPIAAKVRDWFVRP